MRVALILGGAGSVLRDHSAALAMGEFHGVVGCNMIGVGWPARFDAWVSLHGDRLKRPWAERRRLKGLPAHHRLIGLGDTPHRFPGQENPGSSGLFALKVALDDLGFDLAVLCGVPMSSEGEHFDTPGPWAAAGQYHAGWSEALPYIRGRARSMSGWTRDLLGAPTAAWLQGD